MYAIRSYYDRGLAHAALARECDRRRHAGFLRVAMRSAELLRIVDDPLELIGDPLGRGLQRRHLRVDRGSA